MPTLLLKISPPQTPERDRALCTALTALTAAILGKRADLTAVMIDALPVSRWAVGGQPTALATAMLEISITAGSNTAEEKARFIQAAFDELSQQLAPSAALAVASYVIVRELPASDWGYGGLTQLVRRTAREGGAVVQTETAPIGTVF